MNKFEGRAIVLFRELSIGDTFDFIAPAGHLSSFFGRCTKISARRYIDDRGIKHQVGSINAVVYHVEPKKDWTKMTIGEIANRYGGLP